MRIDKLMFNNKMQVSIPLHPKGWSFLETDYMKTYYGGQKKIMRKIFGIVQQRKKLKSWQQLKGKPILSSMNILMRKEEDILVVSMSMTKMDLM